jgi:hypothetical protein
VRRAGAGALERLLAEDIEERGPSGRHRQGVREQRAAVATLSTDTPDALCFTSVGAISEAISSRIP